MIKYIKNLLRTTEGQKKFWQKRKIDWRQDYLVGVDPYSGQPMWNHPHRQVIRKFLEQIPWYSLMEVGCGAGANLVQLAVKLRGRPLQLGGTDVSKEAIAVAETNGFFKDGVFFVCPSDDIMMSDKSTDVILSDMNLIYVSPKDIDRYLKEFKRVARSWIVLCEFDSTDWFKRLWIKLISGYNVYDYKSLLDKNGYYDIIKKRLTPQEWPGSENTYQSGLRHIIIAKVPQYEI